MQQAEKPALPCTETISARRKECEAPCDAVEQEHATSSQQGGLVSAFAAAASVSSQPATAANDTACDELAALLLPIVPIVFVADADRTAHEAIDIVSQLATSPQTARPPPVAADDDKATLLGLEEAAALEPYMQKLAAGEGDRLRTALPAAVRAVNESPPAMRGGESPTELLSRSLKRRCTRGSPLLLLRYCAACGKSGSNHPLNACARCRAVRYCDAECQRAGWPAHKSRCRTPEED